VDPNFPPALTQFVSQLCARSLSVRPADGEHALALLNQVIAGLSPEQLNYRHTGTNDRILHTRPLASVEEHHDGAGADQGVPFPSGGTQILAHPGRAAHLAGQSRSSASAVSAINQPVDRTTALPIAARSHQPPVPSAARSSTAPRHTGRKIALSLIISLLVAALCVGGGWYWWNQWGPGSYVSVPEVPGLTCTSAHHCPVTGGDWTRYRSLLDEAGISSSTKNAYSESVPQGKMLSLTPRVGSRLPKKSAHVTVTLSQGPRPVTVPSLTGVTAQKAQEQLETAGLSYQSSEEYSDSVAAGSVIATNPGAGQSIRKGSTVHVTVSRGPQMVSVPSVVGMGRADAVSRLEKLGLKVKTQPSLIGEHLHQVFSQSVSGGQRIRLHDTHGNPTVITLTIV
jgi:beta-lactam-binding protein with PASTA domain